MSKLPDFKEITSMTNKLFNDIASSVKGIVKEYKEKRAAEEAKESKPAQSAKESPAPKAEAPKKAEDSESKENGKQ